MKTRQAILASLLLSTSPLISHVFGQTVYMNDFQGSVGSEWSATATETPPADDARRFLGRFSDDTVSLSLSALPAHTSLSLDFDLFIMSSWDGDGPEGGTPDIWSMRVAGGPTLAHTTFSNFSGRTQDHPDVYDDVPDGATNPPKTGAVEVNTLGYPGFLDFSGGDCVYHMHFDIPHTASSVVLSFVGGPGLTSVGDESWGLDNVSLVAVDTVPPMLMCPPIVSVIDDKGGPPGDFAFFSVTATDDCDPAPSVVCVPPSGSFFPRGTTIVTCTATDASGNQSVCMFPVAVMPSIREQRL